MLKMDVISIYYLILIIYFFVTISHKSPNRLILFKRKTYAPWRTMEGMWVYNEHFRLHMHILKVVAWDDKLSFQVSN